jgi:sialic acid synthase
MSKHQHTYIIGEIGQNHNGSVDIAKLIIDAAARPVRDHLFDMDLPRIDAVKLTKRDLAQELSASQMSREYNSPHSFGKTYGEHRSKLELTDAQHYEIYLHAKSHGLDFVETLCAKGCLSITKYFMPDRLKVASRDLTNLPLLTALAETQIPIILSTGMGGYKEIDDALKAITRYHSEISILHCVSEYPTRPENANLLSIKALKNKYPEYSIGYSDHTVGISAPVSAVAMGAEIIEKHITLDRHMKGTDQAGSLGVEGIQRMVRDIRLIERSMGIEDVFIADSTVYAKHKLERSIATNREIKAGEIIQESDLHLLSPGDGFKWHELNKVVGKKAVTLIPSDEIIYPQHIS